MYSIRENVTIKYTGISLFFDFSVEKKKKGIKMVYMFIRQLQYYCHRAVSICSEVSERSKFSRILQ